MKITIYLLAAVLILLGVISCKQTDVNEIDLAGQWKFQIDSLDQGIKEHWFNNELEETVNLPGSMVENNKGNLVSNNTIWVGNLRDKKWFENDNYKPYLSDDEYLFPYWLIPEKHYYGAAWYQKIVTIPSSWEKQYVELYLERCHWETQVWIDGAIVGQQNSLGTAHRYNLTDFLSSGKHRISICVDNRMKDVNVGPDSHSISDHTQSNWNGIVGELKLIKKSLFSIADVQVFPDVATNMLRIEINLDNSTGEKQSAKFQLKTVSIGKEIPDEGELLVKEIEINKHSQKIIISYPMGENVQLWDEFNPNLYSLFIEVKTTLGIDKQNVQFGMREFNVKGTRFAINGRPVFLRGTLECAIFPKTGYPPTDIDSWKRIVKICQAHGLNHMRFHSWCPPEAAFTAADELGFYYQVECSSWANSESSIGDGKPIDEWIYNESESIVKEYGNHPSFCLMAYGNEPGGSNQQKYLGDFVNHWKSKDNRRVYTGGAGWPVINENDFHNIPQPRIQGWGEQLRSIINSEPPRTDYDWSGKLMENDRPVISHEIGQWCVYPNLKEIKKYDGVLKATNFKLFKRSLEAHKMGNLSHDFLLASGKLQALCYKAEIEAALRTPGFGGFQLLDLHDFPGQGTALVGVLDAFWEEKGYISSDEYSRFCNETVPLARFTKRIFQSDEIISVKIEVAHFGEKEFQTVTPKWKIVNKQGIVIHNGELLTTNIPLGNGIELGEISTKITTEKPQQLTLEVEVADYSNSWDIWVYPSKQQELNEDILVVQKLDKKALSILNEGGKVLLTVKKGSIKPDKGGAIGIGFSSIFWNTAWTNGQKPHTLGVLCDPKHSALAEFPTEYHSNWQWWDAMSHSNAISLEDFSEEIQPLVRVIDDWVTNRRLALIFEVKIGEGKLIVSGVDMINDVENRPEAKQLLFSLKKYMTTESFAPTVEIKIEEITGLFL